MTFPCTKENRNNKNTHFSVILWSRSSENWFYVATIFMSKSITPTILIWKPQIVELIPLFVFGRHIRTHWHFEDTKKFSNITISWTIFRGRRFWTVHAWDRIHRWTKRKTKLRRCATAPRLKFACPLQSLRL